MKTGGWPRFLRSAANSELSRLSARLSAPRILLENSCNIRCARNLADTRDDAASHLHRAAFFPEEEIAPTIVKLIDNAQHSLDIAAFAFTHPDIANAVIRAHQRGVKVRMVMDMVNEREKNSLAPEIIKAGIPLRVRHKRGFQHSRYLIIDQSIIVTGSFNFTGSADERNAENIVIIRNAMDAEKQFADDFKLLVSDSVIE